ncbi:MAG: hypothetical protein ACKO34_02940 [Vampirovibrionales bacterium]
MEQLMGSDVEALPTALLPWLEQHPTEAVLAESLASPQALQRLHQETVTELAQLHEGITALDALVQRLTALRQRHQTLQALQHSLETLIKAQEKKVFDDPLPMGANNIAAIVKLLDGKGGGFRKPDGLFYPDVALAQADTVLKRKQSINYEMFRAIVFAGGVASTTQVRGFLVEQNVQSPRTKQPFDELFPLSDIAARLDYLVKKGLVRPEGNGRFWATVGWETA